MGFQGNIRIKKPEFIFDIEIINN